MRKGGKVIIVYWTVPQRVSFVFGRSVRVKGTMFGCFRWIRQNKKKNCDENIIIFSSKRTSSGERGECETQSKEEKKSLL